MSWEQLQAIRQEQADIVREERSTPPVACPNDGEPLDQVGDVLHCRYDGWTWDGYTGSVR